MDLYEWTKQYIRFRDSIKKQIINQRFGDKDILVEKKTGIEHYFIEPELDMLVNKIQEKEATYLVCVNSKKNISTVFSIWDKLIEQKKLTIIFANPQSNQSWLIKPRLHEQISEREQLKKGLQSLYNSIETVD